MSEMMLDPETKARLQSLVEKFEEWRRNPGMTESDHRMFFRWVLNPASVDEKTRWKFEHHEDFRTPATVEFVRRIRAAAAGGARAPQNRGGPPPVAMGNVGGTPRMPWGLLVVGGVAMGVAAVAVSLLRGTAEDDTIEDSKSKSKSRRAA